MIVLVPDHIAGHYMEYAERTGRKLNGVISAQLERFQHLPPGKRHIVVDPDLAQQALGGGLPVRDEQDLLHRIQQLAGLSFGHVRLDLNAAQLTELEYRASRQGRPVERLIREIADQILRDLFWVSGGGPAKAPQASAPTGEVAPVASTSGGR